MPSRHWPICIPSSSLRTFVLKRTPGGATVNCFYFTGAYLRLAGYAEFDGKRGLLVPGSFTCPEFFGPLWRQ